MRCRIVPIPADSLWEGRFLMRTATIVTLLCMAGALGACSHSDAVEFVASNPDSVLLDFAANPPGELAIANDAATQQCQIYSRRTAVLESLNVRGQGGTIRATYLCRGGAQTADAGSTRMMHRQ
jgi:hypothetical protein